jgi:hypothetical protein
VTIADVAGCIELGLAIGAVDAPRHRPTSVAGRFTVNDGQRRGSAVIEKVCHDHEKPLTCEKVNGSVVARDGVEPSTFRFFRSPDRRFGRYRGHHSPRSGAPADLE